MKRRRGPARPRGAGYTIVEVMIVLAVTSVMFVAAATMMRGRQIRSEFTKSVRDFEAKLESTISEVVNGGYSTTYCSAGASGTPTVGNPAINNPGSCVFLGKIYSRNGASPWEVSDIDTIVGRRLITGTKDEITSFAEATPTRDPNITEKYTHGFKLRITKVIKLDTNTPIYAFGFIVPISDSGDLSGGTKQVRLYGMDSSDPSLGYDAALNGALPLPGGIIICMEGQGGQFAEITVGGSNTQSMLITELDTTPAPGVCG